MYLEEYESEREKVELLKDFVTSSKKENKYVGLVRKTDEGIFVEAVMHKGTLHAFPTSYKIPSNVRLSNFIVKEACTINSKKLIDNGIVSMKRDGLTEEILVKLFNLILLQKKIFHGIFVVSVDTPKTLSYAKEGYYVIAFDYSH